MPAIIRAMPEVSLTLFHVSGTTLVAEASDFGPLRDGIWWISRIYADAADVGIAIRSHHTGKVVVFGLVEQKKDREGDLQSWEFEILDEFRKISTVTHVTIFND